MNSNTFFSNENRDLLYNLCKDELFRLTSYNIDENKKYYKTFGEIMKIVHKHSDDTSNLTVLNKQVLGKTIPYLQKEIQKKNLKNKPYLPPNQFSNLKSNLPVSFRSESTNIEHEKLEGINSQYDRIMNERNSVLEKKVEPIDFSLQNNNENLEKTNDLLSNNLREREEINKQFNIPDKTNVPMNTDLNKQFSPNLHFDKSNMPSTDYSFQDVQPKPDTFNIESDTINMNNMENLQMTMPQKLPDGLKEEGSLQNFSDDVDPMELYKKYSDERENNTLVPDEDNYNSIQMDKISFEEAQKQANNNIENVLQNKNGENERDNIKFNDSLSYKINKEMNEKNLSEIKGQLDNRIDNLVAPPMNVDTLDQTNVLLQENKLFEEFKKKLFEDRKYVNRENLIIINNFFLINDRN